jgi:hypothetical protein
MPYRSAHHAALARLEALDPEASCDVCLARRARLRSALRGIGIALVCAVGVLAITLIVVFGLLALALATFDARFG